MTEIALPDKSVELVERENAIILKLDGWLQELPEAGQDGAVGILEQIMKATTLEELDKPWQSGGLGEWIGWALDVDNIRKHPSDFPGGPSHFLIADAIVAETGEFQTVMTGSIVNMVQLLVAKNNGLLPLRCVPRVAEKPTKDGFYPQHLQVFRRGMALSPASEKPRAEKPGFRDGRPIAESTARVKAQRLAAQEPAPVRHDVPAEPTF
jgi:hypothetical protein